MKNPDNKDSFSYTYSAGEINEIKKIRDKYTHKSEDKFERLRRLDARVNSKAQVASLSAGIIGTLVLGCGLSLFMSPLATELGIGMPIAVIAGLILSALGGALISLAYPLYNLVLKRERAKIAPEIIMITDELMKG